MSTKESIEELTDEIKKLRKDVKELREAAPHIQYVPYPTYVPYYPPQPYYQPWGVAPYTQPIITWTVGGTQTATSYTITNNSGMKQHFLTNGTAINID